MVPFSCSSCGKSLKVKAELAGKKVKCPACGQLTLIAPATSAGADRSGLGASVADATLPPQQGGPKVSVVEVGGALASGALTSGVRSVAEERTLPPAEQRTHGGTGDSAGEKTHTDAVASELTDFLAPAQAPDEIGRLGPYRILEVLGAGGMGVVYKAEDPALKRQVALKAMLPTLGASESARKRFLREAQTAASIEHDHIVHIYQVGEDRGVPFMAMQFLHGEPLDDRLKREKRLSIPEVLRIGRETAKGLAAAHKRGLIHRDIKPANLWLEAESDPEAPATADPASQATGGRVKILDFGLARAVGDDTQLTQQGAIIGTPAYMAPEQAAGTAVDHRCDLFSLGCVLYRLSTGEFPFKGNDTLAIISALAMTTPPAPQELRPDVPSALSDFIMQMLAKDPQDRPQSAQAVDKLLAEIEEEATQPLAAGRKPAKKALRKPVAANQTQPGSRRWLVPALIAAVVVVLAGGVLVYVNPFGAGGNDPVVQGPPPKKDKDDLTKSNSTTDKDKNATSTGAPLTPWALVTQPAPLPGVESWTLDFRAHRGRANYAAFSPDSKILASAGEDATVRLWDVATGKMLRLFAGHLAPIQALAWSHDSKRLATGSIDKSVLVWDAENGQQLAKLAGHEKPVTALAFAPDGKTIASGAADNTVRLWELPSGDVARIFKPHNAAVHAIIWNKSSDRLVSISGNRFIYWERATGNVLYDQADMKYWVWSPDNQALVYLTHKGTGVHIWDMASGGSTKFAPADQDQVVAVALHWDKKILATSNGKAMKFWDIASGNVLRTATPKAMPRYTGMWFSPDGKSLAAQAVYHHGIDLWSVDKAENFRFLQGLWHTEWPRFTPDNKYLCAICEYSGKHTAAVWNTATAKRWHIHIIHPDSQNLAWSPDGQRLAAASYIGLAIDSNDTRIWDMAALELVNYVPAQRFTGVCLAWSRDGQILARNTQESGAELWTPKMSKPVRMPRIQDKFAPNALAFSPHADVLAGWAPEGGATWDAKSGKPLNFLPPKSPLGYVIQAAWSPDGKTAATINANWDGVDLWDMTAGKHAQRLLGHKAKVNAVAWSPDGTLLASGGADQTVRVWKQSGEFVTQLADQDGRQKFITALAWLPDNKTLLALCFPRTLCIWDATKDKLLQVHKGPDTKGRFSPDGKLVASIDTVAGIRLWDTATGQPRGVLVFIQPESPNQYMVVSPDGHYRALPPRVVEQELVYVAKTARGMETLTPEEFAQKYSWKNDPDKVGPRK